MGRKLSELLSGGKAPVWLDFYDYAGALFAGADGIPWLDDTAFAAFHAKAQALLRSDIVTLPAGRVAAALVAARPALSAAMRAKSRPGYPLRRLLEDESLRRLTAALMAPLGAAAAKRPLALAIPSPRRWLALAYEAAHGEALEAEVAADEDEIDGAAVYVADFLRGFAEAGIDVVLLCEDGEAGPADADALALYDPVLKTARHYRWEVGLLDPQGRLPAIDAGALDFLVAPEPGHAAAGRLLPADFWSAGGKSGAAAGGFSFGAPPVGAVPETVLERIAALRGLN